MIASRPDPGSFAVPEVVRALAAGRSCEAVWRNELGGLTFRIDGGREYLKWDPAGLADERSRLEWAVEFTSVPRVLDSGDGWLRTAGMPGRSAVDERWLADPATAVAAVGEGLRELHEALPVARCPFDWTTRARVEVAHERARRGLLDPARLQPEHRSLDIDAVLRALDDAPEPETVVCHGDACAPNTLVTDGGRVAGHVDLGSLGVGDRWADLAVATWSTAWNYGPGWERRLLDAYGISADAERIAYHRLLWDVAS
ncbi:phosphotransferase [Saccharopolyspora griseoalba]|uniref:Phosphotransferase n=1 Tax=Saccharopolyspora griseoalba TaxID=1431848 RepID=A0ABW2LRY3_9PSEU